MLGGAFEKEGAEKKEKGGWGGGLTGLGRIYIGACCTRGARHRR